MFHRKLAEDDSVLQSRTNVLLKEKEFSLEVLYKPHRFLFHISTKSFKYFGVDGRETLQVNKAHIFIYLLLDIKDITYNI